MKVSYEFKKIHLVFLIGILAFFLSGYSESAFGEQQRLEEYPIATDVFTTLQRTVVPDPKPSTEIHLSEVSKYKQYGYGGWKFGDPLKDQFPSSTDGDKFYLILVKLL